MHALPFDEGGAERCGGQLVATIKKSAPEIEGTGWRSSHKVRPFSARLSRKLGQSVRHKAEAAFLEAWESGRSPRPGGTMADR